MQAWLTWHDRAVNRVKKKKLVFCQGRRCEETGLGFEGGTFFPLSFPGPYVL